MASFQTAMRIVVCISIAALLVMGCNTKKSSSSDPGTGPQEPAAFVPYNPGTVQPDYGAVAGVNNVTVVLPVDFEAEIGKTQVYFGDVAGGILGNEATNVFIDPGSPWYLNCTVPSSFDGTRQVADVIVVNPPDGDGGAAVFPPPGSVTLERAYTYINTQSEVVLLTRDTLPTDPMTDLVVTDYNADGWPDIVGRHPLADLLVFVKNDKGTLAQEKTLPIPAGGYTGLLAGNVNGDLLDDLVVHGSDGFLVLKNKASSPGNYDETVYSDLRSGELGGLVDMDLDGFGDLVLGGPHAIRIFFYTEDTGNYPQTDVATLPGTFQMRGLAVGDVDGNEKPDIITLTDESTGWYLNTYLNDIVGTWNKKAIVKQPPVSVNNVVNDMGIVNLKTVNLDNDKLADIVFTGADQDWPTTPYPDGVMGVVLGGFNEVKYHDVPGVGRGITGARDFVVVDADKDFHPDLLVLAAGWNSVIFYKGDGAGGLTPEGYQAAGKYAEGLAGLDVNKDGKPDLVAAEPGSSTLSYLENTLGEELFRDAVDQFLDWFPTRVVAGDLDFDRYIDLVIMDSESNMVAVLLNDGEGGFFKLKEIPIGGGKLESFCLFQSSTDDDIPDLAVIASNGMNDPGTMTVLISDGVELFAVSIQIPVGPNPLEIFAEDVNNDGNQDLTVAQNGGNSLALFLSDGKDGFNKIEERTPITLPVGLTLSDLDNDFDLDGIVASPSTQTLYILPTDINGSLNLAEGSSVIDAMSKAYNTAAADYSLDGFADIASNAEGEAAVYFFINDAFRNFTFQGTKPLSGEASSLASVDLDFDHQVDLSAAVPGAVDLLENIDGDLNRVTTLSVNGFNANARILWIDVNGDLLPELLVPSHSEKKLSILINTSKE